MASKTFVHANRPAYLCASSTVLVIISSLPHVRSSTGHKHQIMAKTVHSLPLDGFLIASKKLLKRGNQVKEEYQKKKRKEV